MSKSQSPALELTIVSAEGLRYGNRSITKNAFVTVRTDPTNQQSTAVDQNGGSYPSWNEKFHLPLPPSAKWVVAVEVRRKTSSGSQLVGMANIPKADIVGDYIPPYHIHFLSYRLRGSDGGKNGIINLSIKMVGHPETGYPVISPMGKMSSNSMCSSSSSSSCGFVIGYPVTKPQVHHVRFPIEI
ncbi:hypothetical protein AAC387_Pa08g1841 [Persea americana]